MADDDRGSSGDTADEERAGARLGPDDMGEPITELRTLEADPPSGFLARLLGALRRRDLSSQLATLSWTGFGAVLLEFIKVIFSIFDTGPTDREERTDVDANP